jgi:hypothetical protein
MVGITHSPIRLSCCVAVSLSCLLASIISNFINIWTPLCLKTGTLWTLCAHFQYSYPTLRIISCVRNFYVASTNLYNEVINKKTSPAINSKYINSSFWSSFIFKTPVNIKTISCQKKNQLYHVFCFDSYRCWAVKSLLDACSDDPKDSKPTAKSPVYSSSQSPS